MKVILIVLSLLLLTTSTFAQAGWTIPRLLNQDAGTQGLPFIGIGPNNNVAIACSEHPTPSATAPRVAVYRSTDRGRTFSHSLIPLPALSYLTMGPSGISYDNSGNLFVLWGWSENNFPFYTSNLVLSKSTDGGATFTMFWQTRQPVLWLRENPLFIDITNTIHLLWDSTIVVPQFELLYSKFINGSPSNVITRVVPKPATQGEGIAGASMVIAEDTVHLVMQPQVEYKSHYTKSTDGGGSFSAFSLIDSSWGPTLVSSTLRNAILYGALTSTPGRYLPVVRFLADSGQILWEPFVLGSKWIQLDGSVSCVKFSNHNYLAYDGFDGQSALTCYYEYMGLDDPPIDSAFFSFGVDTRLAIDPLGGKHLLGARWGEYKLYITQKDVITTVEGTQSTQAAAINTLSASVNQITGTVTISLHLNTTLDGNLTLYDILGREVLVVRTGTFTTSDHQFAIQTGALSSGTYFVVFRSRAGMLTSKFVLIH